MRSRLQTVLSAGANLLRPMFAVLVHAAASVSMQAHAQDAWQIDLTQAQGHVGIPTCFLVGAGPLTNRAGARDGPIS
jgi:hypothetical protein